MKKQSILSTMRKWSPKIKLPKVEKQQSVVTETPTEKTYKKWWEDNQ